MRKLVLFMHMSLDGYVKARGKDKTGKDQTVSSPGEDPGVEETVVPELIRDADTLLLGRLVADELLEYWLNAEARAQPARRLGRLRALGDQRTQGRLLEYRGDTAVVRSDSRWSRAMRTWCKPSTR